MNIFGGRPGIAAGVLAVIAILAAAFFTYSVNITILIMSAVFVAMCIVLCAYKYITPYRLFVNAVVTIVFCAALLRGLNVFYTEAPEAETHCGENKYIHATVTERVTSADYYTVYYVRLHSVDGVEYDGKAVLNCAYNSELQEGYEFVMRNVTVEYVPFHIDEEVVSYVKEEIFLWIETEAPEDYMILSEGNFTVFSHLRRFNSYLCAKLKNGVKGEEGRLAAAMLLGDKASLTSRMYRDFTRAGLSHYLAVSGLHVSIITGVVSFILLQLRMKRWIRNLLISIFAVGYLFLLGFPVSAIRSVLMLLTVFFAYSMGDSSDSLNALGIAAAVIVLITPTAVFEKSFVLSFCATLGIVCFMPLFNEILAKAFNKKRDEKEAKKPASFRRKALKKTVSFVFGTLMSVSAALSLTLLPVTYLFGETSVLGYHSNFAVALAATPLLTASLFYLLLGDVTLVGDALEFIIEKSARYMIDVAAQFSERRGAQVSLVSKEVRTIVLVFGILIIILLIIKLKNKNPLLLAPMSYPIIILAIILIVPATLPDTAELTFISTGKDETVFVACGEESAIIDISDGSTTRLRTVSSKSHQAGYTEFDALILTHYHTKHLATVSRFISEEMVRKVILPYPQTEADAWIMAQLVDLVQSAGVACEIAQPFEAIELPGGVYLNFSDITRLDRSDHPMLFFSVCDDDERITYVGESSWEYEGTALAEMIGGSDIIFFGGHGPVAKVPFDIDTENVGSFVIADSELAEYVFDRALTDSADGTIGVEFWKYVFSEDETE